MDLNLQLDQIVVTTVAQEEQMNLHVEYTHVITF